METSIKGIKQAMNKKEIILLVAFSLKIDTILMSSGRDQESFISSICLPAGRQNKGFLC